MAIMSEVISTKDIKALDFVFTNSVVKRCFDNNMWIAGGFARKVGLILLGAKNKKSNLRNDIITYLNAGSDIDFFSEDENTVHSTAKSIDKHMPGKRPLSATYGPLSIRSEGSSVYTSPFAKNILARHSIDSSNRTPTELVMQIQLVTKFCFENIKKCLDSFDITNCKYAIVKKHDHYVLKYDSNALVYDSLDELHLCHSNSPYTINRIAKYLRREEMKQLSKCKKSVSTFKSLLFRLLADDWDSFYNIMSKDILNRYLFSLNHVTDISVDELSIFIGSITKNVVKYMSVPCASGYGVSMIQTWKKVDWATYEINLRSEETKTTGSIC